jgi:hypothetical protein
MIAGYAGQSTALYIEGSLPLAFLDRCEAILAWLWRVYRSRSYDDAEFSQQENLAQNKRQRYAGIVSDQVCQGDALIAPRRLPGLVIQ